MTVFPIKLRLFSVAALNALLVIAPALSQDADEAAPPPSLFEYDRTSPNNILPGPYVLPGSQQDDPFRAPAPDEEDDISDDFLFFGILGDDDGQIQTDDLGNIPPATLGPLTASAGALPYEMWQGTGYELAQAIVARLPVASSSFAMNGLASRLLLSPSRLPEGAPVGDLSLLDARIKKLMDSGRVDQVQALLDVLPMSVEASSVREARLDMALLSGDYLTACAISRDARAQSGEARWIKILAFCSAIEGDLGGADFRLNLLRETDELAFEFEDLIHDIAGLASGAAPLSVGGIASVDAQGMDALMFAMLSAGRREVPLEDLAEMPPLYLDAMSRRADLSTDYRIEVARMAAMRGLMRGKDFSDLIAAIDVTEGELGAADLLGETSPSARTDAVMIHAALAASDMTARADMLRAAWQRAVRMGTVAAMAGPLSQTLETMPPTPELVPFAHDAVRISVAAGNIVQARTWLDLVQVRAAHGDRVAQQALVKLWPLALVGGLDRQLPFNGGALELWMASHAGMDPDAALRQRGLYYALLGIDGYDVGVDEWNRLVMAAPARTGVLPPYGVWRQFLLAAEAGRYGESLALGLVMLGEGGAAGADPAVLASVVSVYKAMGLETAARDLAVEAMIENGF